MVNGRCSGHPSSVCPQWPHLPFRLVGVLQGSHLPPSPFRPRTIVATTAANVNRRRSRPRPRLRLRPSPPVPAHVVASAVFATRILATNKTPCPATRWWPQRPGKLIALLCLLTHYPSMQGWEHPTTSNSPVVPARSLGIRWEKSSELGRQTGSGAGGAQRWPHSTHTPQQSAPCCPAPAYAVPALPHTRQYHLHPVQADLLRELWCLRWDRTRKAGTAVATTDDMAH